MLFKWSNAFFLDLFARSPLCLRRRRGNRTPVTGPTASAVRMIFSGPSPAARPRLGAVVGAKPCRARRGKSNTYIIYYTVGGQKTRRLLNSLKVTAPTLYELYTTTRSWSHNRFIHTHVCLRVYMCTTFFLFRPGWNLSLYCTIPLDRNYFSFL